MACAKWMKNCAGWLENRAGARNCRIIRRRKINLDKTSTYGNKPPPNPTPDSPVFKHIHPQRSKTIHHSAGRHQRAAILDEVHGGRDSSRWV